MGNHDCLDATTQWVCAVGVEGCAVWQTVACEPGAQCVQQSCTPCAVPGATCGLDACGQPIGTCPAGQVCDGLQCVPATTGQNPTPGEIDQAVAQIVQEFPLTWTGKDGSPRVGHIPTRVVKAILWQESHWRQYGDNGAVLQGKNGTTTDYGLMQVNGPNNDPTMLAMSWMDNLRQGVSVLRSKWQSMAYDFEDPSILENWYYPVAAYNGLSLDGVNDPSVPGSKSGEAYYQAHPELLGNHLTYQDRVFGIMEAPSQWPVNAYYRSQGRLEDLPEPLVRPYAIPSWVTPGVAWSSQGYTWVRIYTSEADSFGKPDDVPALHTYGYVLHRWVEDAAGGHVELVPPTTGVPTTGSPTVSGWKNTLETTPDEPVAFAGTLHAPGGASLVRFVIGTATGTEDVQSYPLPTPQDEIDLSTYGFNPGTYDNALGTYVVNLQVGVGGAPPVLVAVALVTVREAGFQLSFPVAGYTAWSAPINSVFDHAMTTPYQNNGQVVAYTGEVGDGKAKCVKAGGRVCGRPNAAAGKFQVNGHYLGAGDAARLWYEGHPGIDYHFARGTQLLATAPGVVSSPNAYGSSKYNILQIDHGNGYVTQYWHCDSHIVADGTQVDTGDPVATVGDQGAKGAPHLHLEIHRDGVPVDPYGWTGEGADPYTKAVSENLWGTNPGVGGATPCLAQCVGNTVCAGAQCLPLCDTADDCPGDDVCVGGLCAPPCAAGEPGACLGEEQAHETLSGQGDAGAETIGAGGADAGAQADVSATSPTTATPSASSGGGCAGAPSAPASPSPLGALLGLLLALGLATRRWR